MTIEQILSQLVSIYSIFPKEKRIAEWIEGFLQERDWQTKRQYIAKNRFNVLAEKGVKTPSIVFSGHLDTVPVYGLWKTDPFKLIKQGDRLIGLGVYDMKGGLAAVLASSQICTNKGRKVKLVFCVDEENISLGAYKLIEEYKDWFSDASAIFVPEPGTSKTSTGGVNVLTLGRRGRAVYKINIFGKSAHGANPDKGINAISKAAQIIKAIDQMKLPVHPKLGRSSAFVRYIYGSSTSLSIPEEAVIEVDRHLVVSETIESALKELQQLITSLYKQGKLDYTSGRKTSVSVKKRKTPYLQPYVIDERLRVVKQTKNLIRRLFGEVKINYGLSVADENVFAHGLNIPILTIGPRGGNAHSANEWVSLKSLKELVKIYQAILKQIPQIF